MRKTAALGRDAADLAENLAFVVTAHDRGVGRSEHVLRAAQLPDPFLRCKTLLVFASPLDRANHGVGQALQVGFEDEIGRTVADCDDRALLGERF